jgi:superfamily II DNA or RNA helicase
LNNKHELRQYQKDAITNLSESFKNGNKHVILQVATGGGKTSIASSIIKKNHDKNPDFKAMFICDRIELINQTSKRFLDDGINHGVIQSDHPLEDHRKKIQVCSIQSLARREYAKPNLIFIDEAHTLYTEHKNIIERWPDVPIVGLTATPYTKGLGNYFKKLIVGANTRQLIDLGFLVNPRVFAPSKPDLEKIKIVKGDYDNTELGNVSSDPKIIGDIIEHWLKLAYNKPTICFAVNIAHSKAIREAFWEANIHCEHLDAYTDDIERKNIIKKFKNGEIKILTSVDILSKGFDYPGAEVAILARPTKSLSLYIQQVGRVLRISPETGKKDALILDHSGNTEVHGFCDEEFTVELDTTTKGKASQTYKKVKEEINAVCPSCFFVRKTFKCENCGFEHQPKNTITNTDGYLVEIVKDENNNKIGKLSAKDFLSIDKIDLYSQLLQMCEYKKWKAGRAYFLYKDIVGVFPSNEVKSKSIKKKVTEEVYNMVTHLNIKNARSKYKK